MSSEREGIYLLAIFKRLEIDIVHHLVAGVNDLGFNVAGLSVFTVLIGFPHLATEVFNGKSGYGFEVTLLAVPMTSVGGQPFRRCLNSAAVNIFKIRQSEVTCHENEDMSSLERLILEIFNHCKHCNRTVFLNTVCAVGMGVDDNAFALFFTVKHTPEGFRLCIFVDDAFKSERCECTFFRFFDDLLTVL